MVHIRRTDTETKNLFTFFEFCGFDTWEEADVLARILTEQMGCRLTHELIGPYSKHHTYERNGFLFKLLHHDDIGNCLCNQFKQDVIYYTQLGEIAEELLEKLLSLLGLHC